MANHKSAKKAIRTIAVRTAINKARVSRIRTFIKKVDVAIASGSQEAAMEAFRTAESEIMRGVSKGVFHKNMGARKVSRLAQHVKNMKVAS